MMKSIRVEWHESGLILGQEGVSDCVTVPNLLKENFYEHLLTNALIGGNFSWTDLYENTITFHYQFKNKFNCFVNGLYIGDLPFITMTNNTVAIPLDTTDKEQIYEVYTSDDEMSDCYLLYQSELF